MNSAHMHMRSTGKDTALLLCRLIACLSLIPALAAGCAPQRPVQFWQGPDSPAPIAVQNWDSGRQIGQLLQTPHYRIFTTISDPEITRSLAQVMEGASTLYRRILPQIPPSDKPLDCYLFATREQWDSYTQRYAGSDARIYLQIRSGGYTLRDRYVAYYIGRSATFSVAAHEGFHQFVGRHFKGRMPPFLEEGLACCFENISWNGQLPQWDLSNNPPRLASLRNAIQDKRILSLDRLCAMHAGDIVGHDADKIDAFYAQAWAFARFLLEADSQRFLPALRVWLAETAAGTVRDPSFAHRNVELPWNRRAVVPMIEHYFQTDIGSLDQAYQAYLRAISRGKTQY